MSAATVALSRTTALPVSVRRNVLSGVSRFRAHAVLPEKPVARVAFTNRFFLLAHWRCALEGAAGCRAAGYGGRPRLLGLERRRRPHPAAAEDGGGRRSLEPGTECERQRR